MTTIGNVLIFTGVPERIDNPSRERFITVRLHGGGAVDRRIKSGKTPVAFTGYRVRAGQFIYSRIDARNGAFAIVPSSLDGAVVSKDFPVFDIRRDVADASYLAHFFRSGRLRDEIQALSRGATNRQRIREDMLLALPIPLPSPSEQRRIATILDQADTLGALRRRVLDHLHALEKSIFQDMFGGSDPTAETIRFGDVAALSAGRNLVAEDSATDSAFRVLKISSVTSGEFKPQESKPLPQHYVPPDAHLVRPGDLLMSRANTAELVGAVAHVCHVPPNLALPDKIWRFEWHNPESEPVFYRVLFQTAAVRRRVSQMSSGTGGSMKNLSKVRLETLTLPDVDVEQQRLFAQRVATIPRTDAVLLDELFTSLQTRAFWGEL